jgi:hypothetical protein
MPTPAVVVYRLETPDNLGLERYLHQLVGHVRRQGEWFRLSEGQLLMIQALQAWPMDEYPPAPRSKLKPRVRQLVLGFAEHPPACQPAQPGEEQPQPARKNQIRRGGRRVTCKRCGWTWAPLTTRLPPRCANEKCRSPYWNIPRQQGRGHV